MIGGEDMESKLEPNEEKTVKEFPNEITPFVFTYDYDFEKVELTNY